MEKTATLTMDAIERSLAEGEASIARIRRSQMVLIREADRRQTPLADGCRSMAEWVAGRLDVAPETAKALVTTARRLESFPSIETAVGDGSITYDRTVAVASGLSRKWRLGVSEASASSGKDAQRRRSRDCVEAEDAARGVEGRRDTVPISATDH
jgi:hypothetical protein